MGRMKATGGNKRSGKQQRKREGPPVSHVAFADESSWNEGRYRSICLVSAPRSEAIGLHRELEEIIGKSGFHELKWSRLRSARTRDASLRAILSAVEAVKRGALRVDVLCWDIEDSRHNVEGRDDMANLQRMYFHLLRRVLSDSWPDGARWSVYPDEQGTMDWSALEQYLDRRSDRWEDVEDLAPGETGGLRYRDLFRIEKLVPSRSHELPLIQLADLFAGLSVFSRNRYGFYREWADLASGQVPLDAQEKGPGSRADRHRFVVLHAFDEVCKQSELGISLRRYRGLRSFRPSDPIDFWWWEPQGSYDKAPTRK
jgi:hypothetical protein